MGCAGNTGAEVTGGRLGRKGRGSPGSSGTGSIAARAGGAAVVPAVMLTTGPRMSS
jgi:hypothetical protein